MKFQLAGVMLAAATIFASGAASAVERSGFFELPNPFPSGTGNPNFSFSSAGGTPTFTNPTPGEYNITFPGLAHGFAGIGEGGNVQATAHQPFFHCNPMTWDPVGNDLRVVVHCFNRFGGRDNATFVASYRQMVNPVNAPGTLRAYVWSTSVQAPTIPGSILIHPLYSFNSLGGTNTVEQLGTGWYRVLMPGMSSTTKGGNVMVSAYDAVNGQMRYCKVAFWNSFSGSSTLEVQVVCFAPDGTPADSRFTLSYGLNTQNKIGSSAYLWSETPFPAPNFTPNLFYQAVLANRSSNTATYLPSALPSGNITITQGIPGFYTVTVPRLNALGTTNVLVTAYGFDSNYCWIAGWQPNGANQRIQVACGDSFGSMAPTLFSLQFGTSQAFFF